jgi:hypothetical protein
MRLDWNYHFDRALDIAIRLTDQLREPNLTPETVVSRISELSGVPSAALTGIAKDVSISPYSA